jgi:hypothetical protein
MIRTLVVATLLAQLALATACGEDRLPAFADPPDAGADAGEN